MARPGEVLDRKKRAEISEATKARMADPAVRQRIRDGMRRASGEAAELQSIDEAWRAARPSARLRFLAQFFEPPCYASASSAEDQDA